ncbi:expressed unknown protein [Seminavis robusta]|uniref:Uncharacterized protein n=1 Tax=Seminavis robusta TaxID=568900 RepID=A0A9N8EQT7_9STRA|nr:expressed unknown protein [Seminavis robusta]|eukprot:Sro1698_g291930.1 n/a (106) ;mRNA; f:1523-1840
MSCSRRVTFQGKEVSSVKTFEPLDSDQAKELFYQDEDYIRFRSDFAIYKAQAAKMECIRRVEAIRKRRPAAMLSAVDSYNRISRCPSQRSPFRRSVAVNGCAMMA